MEKELTMDCDEALEYIKNNVKIFDMLELSYNRIFTPGEVLNVDTSEYGGKAGLKLVINVSEEHTASAIEVDMEEIKDDLIEVRHFPKDSDDLVSISIERCLTD